MTLASVDAGRTFRAACVSGRVMLFLRCDFCPIFTYGKFIPPIYHYKSKQSIVVFSVLTGIDLIVSDHYFVNVFR